LWITHDLGSLAGLPWRLAVLYAGRVVVEGPLAALLAAPRHPYTAALAGARPRRGRPLVALPGRLPAPAERPSGCRFRARCPLARERCALEEPELVAQEDGARASACHFAGEVRPA
jgi:oligopeptide/dipeptide ABC transporter ATP-binding protein